MKTLRIFLLALIIIGIALICTQKLWVTPLVNKILANESAPIAPTTTTVADYKNATYTIDGEPFTLVNGRSDVPAVPGSSSEIVTQYFGNMASGDLNGDGQSDVAFILTQSGGGSGTFYYVVAALKTASGYEGTNAVLLGDRISPQSTEINGKEVVVNYADRKPTDPMTAAPSVGMTKYLTVQGTTLE